MDSLPSLRISAEAVGMEGVQGNNILFSDLWKADIEYSCFNGTALSPVLLGYEQLTKQHRGIFVSSNGCRTSKGRWPWVPRGIGSIQTWGESSVCSYEQKWNCKYLKPFLNIYYKIGFVFLHANHQLFMVPCCLFSLKAGLSGKIKIFRGTFSFKCFICGAKSCWGAEEKVFLEIKLIVVNAGTLHSEIIPVLCFLWGKWSSWQMEAFSFQQTRLVLSYRVTGEGYVCGTDRVACPHISGWLQWNLVGLVRPPWVSVTISAYAWSWRGRNNDQER